MARIKIEVTMQNVFMYEAPAYGYGVETRYIYSMVAEDGTVYVWKTTAYLAERVESTKGSGIEYDEHTDKWYVYDQVKKGDKIEITASVKGQSEYKGQPQTELTRVKMVKMVSKAKQITKEDLTREKKKEQMESLKDGDFIWRMPYRQYKEHYCDCETLAGSFEEATRNTVATIAVIIRDGRLKASGVRGKHYSGYAFQDENGMRIAYRAISEETAARRVNRENPGHVWELVKVYDYSNMAI